MNIEPWKLLLTTPAHLLDPYDYRIEIVKNNPLQAPAFWDELYYKLFAIDGLTMYGLSERSPSKNAGVHHKYAIHKDLTRWGLMHGVYDYINYVELDHAYIPTEICFWLRAWELLTALHGGYRLVSHASSYNVALELYSIDPTTNYSDRTVRHGLTVPAKRIQAQNFILQTLTLALK